MHLFSYMDIHTQPGQREAAIRAFAERGVFEECAKSIPGFVQAHLLSDPQLPERMVVVAEWTDAQSFSDWIAHPARALQELDLAHFLAAAPVTTLMDAHVSWISPALQT